MTYKKIKFKTAHGIPLDKYYIEYQKLPCSDVNIGSSRWKYTPYEGHETFYYLCKHLALPGIAGALFPFLVLPLISDNYIIGGIGYIITIIIAVLFASVVREFLRGLFYRFKGDFVYLPGPYYIRRKTDSYKCKINDIVKPYYNVGFVGDIMMLKDYELEFHPDIESFFEDVQVIVGNLEGVITGDSRFLAKQAHNNRIVRQLKQLLIGETKWLLCISNNHSEDYSNTHFNTTLSNIQKDISFDVFGRGDVSFIHNYNQDFSIYSPTQWSNQKKWDYTHKYYRPNFISKLIDNTKFNMLYLHWGYENEKYVRSRFKKDAGTLLTAKKNNYHLAQAIIRKKVRRKILPDSEHKWDFIFGHHPHVLQPILKFKDSLIDNMGNKIKFNKLAVFSAGNFTSGANIIRKKKHIHGIIMKFTIGPLKGYNKKLAIGDMEWRRTKNHKIRNKIKKKKRIGKRVCVDNEKYRTYNKPFLLAGVFYLILLGAFFYIITLF